MRPSAGLAASLFFTALALTGCGHGAVIGSGPMPTPTPIVPSVTNEFPVPTANSRPGGITTGADGYLYFTEQNAGNIGQVTTGGSFKEFGIASKGGTTGNNGIDITSGPDLNLWFTEQGAKPGIGKMAIVSHAVTEYPVAGSAPAFIAVGPVHGTLVFTDDGNNAIGQIDATSGTVTEKIIPTAGANPLGLAVGPDGKVYFAENSASKIGIFDPVANTITEIATLTPAAGPTMVVLGPDGAMWFTENNVAKLGRLTTSGLMSEYPLSPTAAGAGGLAVGLDYNLYFGDTANNKIGRFTSASPSTITEYAIPTAGAFPGKLVIGPDGRIYFTEVTANKIGQLNY